MTKNEENNLSMFEPVDQVLTENEAVWAQLPAFVTAHNQFLDTWRGINPDAQVQINGSGGATADKSVQRAELTRLVLLASGNIYAYALSTGNEALKVEMAMNESGLARMRDNILLMAARLVRTTIDTHGAQLTSYGVTAAQIAELDAAILNFETGNGAPRKVISKRKTATQGIKEKLKQCNLQLEIMDKLIENFRSSKPQFVSEYFNARLIVDLGHRSNPGTNPEQPK